MYFADTEGSDYAAEQETGFELENENVLIVQERDNELQSIEETSLALESALNDLVLLGHHYDTLVVAKESVNDLQARVKLNRAIQHRAMLQKKYGFRSEVLAAESFASGGSLIIAIEEEAKEEKGFFGKMIDAIVKAFKWLWEKITSIFKKAKGDGENSSKLKEEDIKALEEKTDGKPSTESFASEKYLKAFSSIGDHVKFEDLRGMLENMEKYLEWSEELMKNTFDGFRLFSAISSNAQAAADDLDKTSARVIDLISSAASKMPARSVQEMEKTTIKVDTAAIDSSSVRGMANIGPKQYFIWVTAVGETKRYSASIADYKEAKPATKIDHITTKEALNVIGTIENLKKAASVKATELEKLSEEMGGGRVDALAAALKRIFESSADNDSMKKAAERVKEISGGFNSIATATTGVIFAIKIAATTIDDCFADSISTQKKKNSETKEDKPKEEKAD